MEILSDNNQLIQEENQIRAENIIQPQPQPMSEAGILKWISGSFEVIKTVISALNTMIKVAKCTFKVITLPLTLPLKLFNWVKDMILRFLKFLKFW